MATAIFGAGCFWGVEELFRHTTGVLATTVGYTGGTLQNPHYRDVCTGQTGHAEAVQIEYDPAVVSYSQLLDLFWEGHDPTQLNRQGPDVGTQYRSAIFCFTEHQLKDARESLTKLSASGRYARPIATIICAATAFWPAEEYHQQYLAKRGLDNCHI